jgi:hypothetical protein
VYHGWKLDVTGACIDMPDEPAESNFKHKVRKRHEAGNYTHALEGSSRPRRNPGRPRRRVRGGKAGAAVAQDRPAAGQVRSTGGRGTP